jgi:hypothetical protein
VLTAAVSALSCGACTSRFPVPSSYPGVGLVTANAIPIFIRYQSSDQQVIASATRQNSGQVTAPATPSAGGVSSSITSEASLTASPGNSGSSETLQTSTGLRSSGSAAASSSSASGGSPMGGGISTGAQIGVGVGGGLLGIIIILSIFLLWRQRRNRRVAGANNDEILPYPELDGNSKVEKRLELYGSSDYGAELPDKSPMMAVAVGVPDVRSSELPTETYSLQVVGAGGAPVVEAPSSSPDSVENTRPTRIPTEHEMPAHPVDVLSNERAYEISSNVVQPSMEKEAVLANLEPPSELPTNSIDKEDINRVVTPSNPEETQHEVAASATSKVADAEIVAKLRAEQARLQEERRRIIRLQELDQQEAEIERKLRDVIPDV